MAPVLADALTLAETHWPHKDPRCAEALQVLNLLGEMNADGESQAAALVHQLGTDASGVVEYKARYPALRPLIEGQQAARKVWDIYRSRPGGNAEGLRRLLLAIIRDLRVVLILLARQLVRMRLAAREDAETREALARLSADIHAPLANRLGIWQLKWELEDLAFRYLQPDTYKRVARLLDERRGDRESFIAESVARVREALTEAGIENADVAGRPKHIYSIWKKMQRKGVDFGELYDIRAIRILVPDVATCYAALGVVHGLWHHIPGEFDDYIANPKGNHYQSLHTAVVGPQGKTLEVQIRTWDMHEHAELGVAAHWRYKEGGSGDQSFERKINWMRQLLENREEGEDDRALLAGFSTELIEDRVYALTPQGHVVDLPRGATVLDFAYHVHTEVGHRCRGAKVNGRIVPLTHQPATGDRIQILTGKVAEPRRDWLLAHTGCLTTSRARNKVRAWFHRLDHARNVQEGRELLERDLKRLGLHQADLAPLLERLHLKKAEELYVAVALGDTTPAQVARQLHELAQPKEDVEPAPTVQAPRRSRQRAADAIVIEGVGNLLTTLARCCQPVPGDPIHGFITRGRGVSIHRFDCPQLARLAARDPSRVLQVEWGGRGGKAYEVDLMLRAYDRKHLLKDVTNCISLADAHVLSLDTRVSADEGTAELRFSVRVADFAQLSGLLAKLAGLRNVIEARRVA
ncbi:MAG TPA: bifunctional (p)ppGpp synthetase/guanosine-3',5'-bis(diphosphate) 3'-pyrophosphohydrolase [Xanthomonadaceae bacterium]|nr:bifunctional (p)ppGpp synthetase/guanosine-3',5'-bis(diphosphate) 3'-pyrophosphohydrolase [Xanthomonadaceae bacterium]